jgi:hypothetical protein
MVTKRGEEIVMAEKKTAFYAYPGKPAEIAQTIRSAILGFNDASPAFNLEGWERTIFPGFRSLRQSSQNSRLANFLRPT